MNLRIDPTKEPILKSVVFLSIPMMLEMGAQNLFNLVDTYFVSRIAYEAIGALVTSSMVAILFLSISVGISTATGMYIATYWGAKKYKRAKFLYSNALILTFFIAILFSALVLIFLPNILSIIGLKGLTLLYAEQYLSISAMGFVLNFIFSVNNSTIRSLSLPSLALKVMIIANILNAILDPFFIFYLKLGIKGAALSSIVSIFFGIALQFILLKKSNFSFIGFRVHLKTIKKIIKKGVFASLHLFFRISSMLVLIKVIGVLSQPAISAYGVVIRVYQVLLFMIFGLANTGFVMAGQNYGAKSMDRVKKSAFSIIAIAVLFIGSLNFVLYMNRDILLSLFIDNENVKTIAEHLMFFYAISYPFVIVSTISSRISMALHDTKRPSMVNLFNLWFFQLPLAYFLSLKLQEAGVWEAIAISNLTAFMLNFSIMYANIKKVQNESYSS
jgi:putative MATE family efflux protein